jgi:hypothetical protein
LAPNVGEVIYACGAAWRDGKWVVGYGINNERCAIAQLDAAGVDALLGAVDPVFRSYVGSARYRKGE